MELVEKLGDRSRAIPASEFSADHPGVDSCGVYAWWADETAQRLIESALGADASSVIYVGKAGGGTSSRTLAKRMRDHLRGRIGTSTLRHSLTVILMEDPAFAAAHPDHRSKATRDYLSGWMRTHLQVALVPVDPDLLERAEQEALARYDPPLNVNQVHTPRARLRELREARPR